MLINQAQQNGLDIEHVVARYSEWEPAHMFKRAYHRALVPMFFAVSGFLVTSSAIACATSGSFSPFASFGFFRHSPWK